MNNKEGEMMDGILESVPNDLKCGYVSFLFHKDSTIEFQDMIIDECKDSDVDDKIHLFRSREECTDENYRPPELPFDDITRLTMNIQYMNRDDYYYAFTSNVPEIYGKGKTYEEASDDICYLIRNNCIRCGEYGIYPSRGSQEFDSNFCKNLFSTLVDNKPEYKSNKIENNHKKGDEKKMGFAIRMEDISARAFRLLLKRLIKNNSKSICVSRYHEWIAQGCLVGSVNKLNNYITLDNGNITTESFSSDHYTNTERFSMTYFSDV